MATTSWPTGAKSRDASMAAVARLLADRLIADSPDGNTLRLTNETSAILAVLVEERGVDLAHMVVELNENREGASVVGSPSTSRDAALAIAPKAGTLRRKVLNEVRCRTDGLMTDEMLERALGMKHQTVSARRNELVKGGWLQDSGKRAKTDSGNKAVLWELTQAAKLLYGTELADA